MKTAASTFMRMILSFVLVVSLMPTFGTIPAFAAEDSPEAVSLAEETPSADPSVEVTEPNADAANEDEAVSVPSRDPVEQETPKVEVQVPAPDSLHPQNAEEVASTDESKSEIAPQVTYGWTQCGECEWQISSGVLTVRPLPGNDSGTLGDWGSTSPWERKNVTSAVFESGVKAATCYGMFYDCSKLSSLFLSGLDTSAATNMNGMFYGCASLTSLDLSGFDTANVTDMTNMFYNCSALMEFKVGSGFKACSLDGVPAGTSNGQWWSAGLGLKITQAQIYSNRDRIADVYYAAAVSQGWTQCGECEWSVAANKLTVRPLPGLDSGTMSDWGNKTAPWATRAFTSAAFEPGVEAQTGYFMFAGCDKLKDLDLSNLDTSGVTDMTAMFYDCSSLVSLDLSGFDTSSVTKMNTMFYSCPALTSIDLSSFDTSEATDMSFMFSNCPTLSSLNLSNFNTAKVENMGGMFYGCSSLSSLDISSFNTSNVSTMSMMFDNCPKLACFKVGAGYKAQSIDGIPGDLSSDTWFSSKLGTWLTTEEIYNRPNIADSYAKAEYLEQVADRLYGEDSSETAAAISKEAYPEGSEWVILARNDDFADAMSATGLAGTLNAPIVLTDPKTLSASAAAEITRLGATKCYVIGGTGAISGNVEGQLTSVGVSSVERIAGTESWDTSVKCAEKIAEHGGNAGQDAVVAMSSNFQDALSISSFAYKYGVPIYLETSEETGRALPSEAVRGIRNLSGTIYVAGGSGAVPTATVEGTFYGRNIVRLAGSDGFDTSNQIATYMVDKGLLSADTACVACGAEAAKGSDALAGAALAGKNGGVMLLVNSNPKLGSERLVTIEGYDSKYTPAFLAKNAESVNNAYILGGSYVVSKDLSRLIGTILF